MELVKSYVDDVTKIVKALDHGVRFEEETMKIVIVEELTKTDLNVPEDKRTMKELLYGEAN